MSLPTPLSVKVGGRHLTNVVEALTFRKEALGGVRSIAFSLAYPLSTFDATVAGLSEVTVYDARTATPIAEGRISDTGRGADASGQSWDVVAFGPAQHASDRTIPYVVVSMSTENFKRSANATKSATINSDERGDEDPTVLLSAEQGKTVTTTWQAEAVNRLFNESGMKLARVRCQVDSGVNDVNFALLLRVRTGGGALSTAVSTTASTAAATINGVVVTDFPNGSDVLALRVNRNTSTVTATEDHWFEFWDFALRALLLNANGTEKTTGYTANTVLAHEVVNDLLGRVLEQFDGANATVSTAGTYTIDQMSYPDGVTAEQVLSDLMLLEPAFRWTTGPNVTGNGYSFTWEPWPTTVRYEVTLDDGGEFPSSTQDVYNRVSVRWRSKDGRVRTTTRTMASALLDSQNIVRTAIIDLGDELGSLAAAQRAGDNFLDEHSVPANGGTLNVSRPIRDARTGRSAEPHEIEPGELIRVNGVESYPDALNADSTDGRTVFRIWAVNYSSDTHSAQLELNADARTTSSALAALGRTRTRKR